MENNEYRILPFDQELADEINHIEWMQSHLDIIEKETKKLEKLLKQVEKKKILIVSCSKYYEN